MQTENQNTSHKARYSKCKLWIYCLALSLGAFQFGYALGVYNPTNKVLQQIYSKECGDCWDIDKNKEPYNTLISTVLFVGAFIGSATANIFMDRSRIFAMYIFTLMCMTGSAMQLVISIPVLMVGRFIHGLGAGSFSNLIPMMINQISPPVQRGRTGTLVQIMINVAIFIAAGLGLALPRNVIDVQQSDLLWRFITGVPILVGFLTFLIFFTCYRLDTPAKYIQKGYDDLALKAIEKVYTSNDGCSVNRLNQLRNQLQKLQSSHISSPGDKGSEIQTNNNPESIKNNPKIVLIVCICFSIYQQLTGMNAITFYSAQIFQSDADIGDIYSGNRVTIYTTSVNLGVTLLSTLFVQRFGRKPLLLLGIVVMTIFMFLTGLFQQLGNNTLEQVSIMIYIAGFAISMGPLLWAYLPQALNGGGLGISAVFNWIFVVVISLAVPTMAKLKEWMFYIFAILNLLGFFFVLIFIIESKGKSRRELQMAYVKKFSKLKELEYEAMDQQK